MPKNEAFGFCNIQFVAKHQKVEEGPLEKSNKSSEKKSHIAKKVEGGFFSLVRFCM